MAINQVQGSLVLHEFRAAGTNDPYKPLVCAQGGGVDKNVETTTESTKCGPIVGVADMTWTMSGDAVVNVSPDADQISYRQFNNWMVNKTKLDVRLMSPADTALSLAEGEAFYEQGEGYITSINITTDNGSVVKFSWTFSGNGPISTFGFSEAPEDENYGVGDTIELTAIAAGGEAPYSYQWYKGDVAISGETSEVFTKTAATGDIGDYHVVATDANGAETTSAKASVKVISITTQPASTLAVSVGATLTLSVVATGGTPPLSYQWKKGGVDISGATSATYSKANAQIGDSGSYSVQVRDTTGAGILSSSSTVTVS